MWPFSLGWLNLALVYPLLLLTDEALSVEVLKKTIFGNDGKTRVKSTINVIKYHTQIVYRAQWYNVTKKMYFPSLWKRIHWRNLLGSFRWILLWPLQFIGSATMWEELPKQLGQQKGTIQKQTIKLKSCGKVTYLFAVATGLNLEKVHCKRLSRWPSALPRISTNGHINIVLKICYHKAEWMK